MERAKLLIIDDEIEICLNMKDMLGFENWVADYATTAKEAFELIEAGAYSLLLVDIKLEGRVSGIDIIKTFRDKEKRPKIIVITAIPRDALDEQFEQAGIAGLIQGYLDKPSCSDPDKLIAMTKRALA